VAVRDNFFYNTRHQLEARTMIRQTLLIFAVALVPAFALADGPVLWEGGLWNLDDVEERSTYGDFRLTIEPDIWQQGGHVLRVQWMETIDGKGQRVYANRLIPELSTFIGTGKVKAAMAAEIPSAIKLQNEKGRVLWLRLWEPTRYEIQKTLK
jgi:hypothetical protein